MEIGTKIKMANGQVVTITGTRTIPQCIRLPNGTSVRRDIVHYVFDNSPYGANPQVLTEGIAKGRYQLVD